MQTVSDKKGYEDDLAILAAERADLAVQIRWITSALKRIRSSKKESSMGLGKKRTGIL